MNRLCQKQLLDYVVDENDARVYIYTPLKSRDECLKEKSNRFADSYFSGSHANAAAALLKNITLTEEQAEELKSILEACRFSETGREKEGQGRTMCPGFFFSVSANLSFKEKFIQKIGIYHV